MSSVKEQLTSRLLQFIGENKLADKSDTLLLAVSGGMDSSLMTDLFSKTVFKFGIAHCNFSLRGTESDEEEDFVKNLAEKLGKKFHSKRFDTKKFAEENKLSIQEAARELRYNWLNTLCDEFHYSKIATAHHLDDSIETFFINILRGTGPAGLRGIPVKNARVIRPLLFAKKSEIEHYAKEEFLQYRNDSSNNSDDYLRNRVRHNLLPVIKENAAGFESNMQKLMHEMTFIHAFTMEKMKEWKKMHVKEEKSGNLLVPIRAITKEADPASFLSTFLYALGIKGLDCQKILYAETPGKIFSSSGHEILMDRLNLVIRNKEDKKLYENNEFILPGLPSKIKVGEKQIYIHLEEPEKKHKETTEREIQYVDGDELSLPLTIRPWKAGDYFFPLGMKGKKKISDFYTDIKLNRFEKDKTLILLSGKNIVCILGHRIDERYKIKATTKNILTIEISGQ
jgi:tRNA(Ile)-lysidine synthase